LLFGEKFIFVNKLFTPESKSRQIASNLKSREGRIGSIVILSWLFSISLQRRGSPAVFSQDPWLSVPASRQVWQNKTNYNIYVINTCLIII